jgi:hypothetical protein
MYVRKQSVLECVGVNININVCVYGEDEDVEDEEDGKEGNILHMHTSENSIGMENRGPSALR